MVDGSISFNREFIAPKRMASGKYIDLANFSPEDVDLWDINQSLNCIYRFTGHWKDKKPLTVAQHTALTMHLSGMFFPEETEVSFDCLLHDMPEAYYGDVATPWKRIVGDPLRKAQKAIDAAVYTSLWKLETPFNEEIESKRKVCDLMSLDIERRCMWKSQYGKDLWPDVPSMGMTIKEKEDLFDHFQSQPVINLIDKWELY